MKMLVHSRGSHRYSPEDLISFGVKAVAEDPEYIALAHRRTGEHAWADRPARRDKNLNAARSIHRRTDPG